jgi:hypothetical protein
VNPSSLLLVASSIRIGQQFQQYLFGNVFPITGHPKDELEVLPTYLTLFFVGLDVGQSISCRDI